MFTDRPEDDLHHVLFKAVDGFGTDEAKIWAALESLRDQAHWEQVKANFKKDYPKRDRGDLNAALRTDLSKEEVARYHAILHKKRISVDTPQKAVVDTRPEGPPQAVTGRGEQDAKVTGGVQGDDLHHVLFKAIDGFGTDEEAIWAALES
eukprot:Hpha_TRINITY_DN16867_c0_g1::TRINITY_DN16867_c0_g1_i1::g.149112::m.149112